MNPWEPQQNESSPAYQAFVEYRDLGPDRSLSLCGQKVGKGTVQMERWSVRWSWVERSKAFDAHLDAIRVSAREQAVAKQARKIMTADEVRAELTEIAEAPWRDFVQVKMKDGQVIEADLKLTDKIKSLELMGRNHKLFTDKVDHTMVFDGLIARLKADIPEASEEDLRAYITENVQQIGGVQ